MAILTASTIVLSDMFGGIPAQSPLIATACSGSSGRCMKLVLLEQPCFAEW